MDTLLQFAFYALGFVGLAGITLIPLRSFVVMQRLVRSWSVSVFARLLVVLFALAAVSLLVAEGYLLVRIFGCLIGEHCGPNRASGWIFVAGIGFWYLILETIAVSVGYFIRKVAGTRPNNSFKPKPLRGSA